MTISISINIGNFVKNSEFSQSFRDICYPQPESCPLNNTKNKEVFKEIFNKLQSNSEKYGVKNINGFYMSVLEHEWIMVEANSAHDIEQLCIESDISSFNTVKIVPLKKLSRRPKQTYLIFNKLPILFFVFYIFIENHATIT